MTRHDPNGLRVAGPHLQFRVLEQPPGQPAKVPFAANIRARSDDDLEALGLGQPAELGHKKGSVLSIVNSLLTEGLRRPTLRQMARKLRVQFSGALYHVQRSEQTATPKIALS